MKKADIEQLLAEYPEAVFQKAYNAYNAPSTYFQVVGFEQVPVHSRKAQRDDKTRVNARVRPVHTYRWTEDGEEKVEDYWREDKTYLVELTAISHYEAATFEKWVEVDKATKEAQRQRVEQREALKLLLDTDVAMLREALVPIVPTIEYKIERTNDKVQFTLSHDAALALANYLGVMAKESR